MEPQKWVKELVDKYRSDPDLRAHRAEEANRLLNHELIQEFFKLYPLQIREELFNTEHKESAKREELYTLGRLCKRFEQHFQQYIESGKVNVNKTGKD